MVRMWINQPSSLQPYHKFHGLNVLADLSMATVWFLRGDTPHSMEVTNDVLSPGWVNKSTADGVADRSCEEVVGELLQEYGGEQLLSAVGAALQEVSGSFVAPTVGRIVSQLATLDW